MRSLIILEVEHGEDTDALSDFITEVQNNGEPYFLNEDGTYKVHVTDYKVRVDLPACFMLDS